MFKKVLASATLVAVMTGMLGMTAFASDIPWDTNGGTSTIEGEAYGVEPTISVELPGDLAFGINPLYLDADEDGKVDPQIVTAQYTITNYSNVDVQITTKTKLTVGSDVAIIEPEDNSKFDSKSKELLAVDKKKAIWLYQLLPTAAATIKDGAGVLTVTDIAHDATKFKGDVPGNTLNATDDKEVIYKLAKFDEAKNLQPANVSGFAFSGAVDPNASFAEGDVKVTTVFTLNTLTTNQSSSLFEASDLNSKTYDATVVKLK